MKKETKLSIIGVLLLLLTALIFGFAFVAQKNAMDHIKPLTMNGARSLLAAVFLFPVSLIVDKIRGKKVTILGTTDKNEKKVLIRGGLLCGLFITIASTVQQYGVDLTSTGKSGFLTTLYIIFVPLLGLFLHKKVSWNGWLGVVLATVGTALICLDGEKGDIAGDLLVIVSALFFAIHILVVDKYSKLADGIRLSMFQFIICGTTCMIGALIFERPSFSDILSAWWPIFFAGVLSAGVGYTLQIVAQRWVSPSVAPLVMSLESAFALLAGAVVNGERLSVKAYIGCFVMFVAVIIAQITFSSKKQKIKESSVTSGNVIDDCKMSECEEVKDIKEAENLSEEKAEDSENKVG